MIDLKGHTALVTGSTKGVGRAIAEAFAEAGADVVIHGRKASEDSAASVRRCSEFGVRTAFITGDLSGPTETSVDEVFQGAIEAMPEIDILVNNAGTFVAKPYLDVDLDTYQMMMRLNVTAPYFLTQRFARRWVERSVNGRVLMIGSINGRLAEQQASIYDCTKGAIEMMVKSLCVALAPYNIRVNGLAPGLVITPLASFIEEDPDLKRWMCLHTPNGQVPGAEVCGEGAVYMVSDAARHVHGHMLMIDGGMSGWQQPEPPSGGWGAST